MENKKKKADVKNQKKTVADNSGEFPVLPEAPEKINKGMLSIIPEEVAKKHRMAIFEKKGSLIKVAMVNPHDFESLNVLQFISTKEKLENEIYSVTPEVFQDILDNYTTAEKAVEEVVQSFKEDQLESIDLNQTEKEPSGKESIQDAPVAKLVQVIIRHAIDGRASDVHIEPIEDSYRVRFRVDGSLHSSLVLPKEVGRAVVSRIKILSNLKIDEKRKPQDGRFKIEDSGEAIDFRVSTLPVVEGEKVAMRVLARDEGLGDMKLLGVLGRNFEVLTKQIRNQHGIILITGPTGSGKSTTLYAFLQILNQEERNIVTLEDPVEYHIEGTNQSQIRPEIGYTFANGLRSILRQDPNVIMVGEIRDNETAELAIHAALTGHLVFSTLHTNDAVGAMPRMIDMGVEAFLLTASLRAVVAQRLVRKNCEKCKEEIKIPQIVMDKIKEELSGISAEEISKYGLDLSAGLKFYKGKGCDACGNTGLKGRLAIYEVIEVTEKIQELIAKGKNNEVEIKNEALRQGMITMKQDGILKALKGIMALSEVERVTEGSLSVGGELEDDKG